jgi:hypothetical protein
VKALSLTQPWASLVIAGAKRIETRSWRTEYRGLLAIHASKRLPPDVAWVAREFGIPESDIQALPRGAVLGTVELVDVRRAEDVMAQLSQLEKELGDYSPGRWAWLLKSPIVYGRPIIAHGALGLWEWEP